MVVVLHWLTVLCLMLAATLILVRTQIDGRAARQALLEAHRHFGLAVLALFCIRVGTRLRRRRLPLATAMSRVVRGAATAVHLALYLLLLALPMLGWALSSAEDKPVHMLGLTLPALIQPSFDLADRLLVWHRSAAWVLLGLASLHLVAALWHHFILRDDVLRDMLRVRRQ